MRFFVVVAFFVFFRFCRATGREDEEGRGAPRRAAHGDELQGHQAKSAGGQGRPTGSVQVEKGAISLECRLDSPSTTYSLLL